MSNRTNEHRVETESTNIIRDLIVNEAIFRELSEKDYGIDGVLEFFDPDGKLNGTDVLVQIKGSRNISVRNGRVLSPKINTSSILYWAKKKQSVFILFVDVTNKIIYFEDAKYLARRYAKKIASQKTITFRLEEKHKINSYDLKPLNRAIFIADKFDISKFEISKMIFDFKELYKKLIVNCGRDCFMVLEKNDPRIDLLNDISRSIKLCWLFFRIPARIDNFNHFMALTYEAWGEEYVEMHITETAEYLREQLHFLLKVIVVTRDIYATFWENHDSKVSKILNNEKSVNLMTQMVEGNIGIKNIEQLNDYYY